MAKDSLSRSDTLEGLNQPSNEAAASASRRQVRRPSSLEEVLHLQGGGAADTTSGLLRRVDELDDSYLERHRERNGACLKRVVDSSFDFKCCLVREQLVAPLGLPQFDPLWHSFVEHIVAEMKASMSADARMLKSLFALVHREEAHILDEQQERALETEHFLHKEPVWGVCACW